MCIRDRYYNRAGKEIKKTVKEFPLEKLSLIHIFVTLDICACYKGYHGDSAWSYRVGTVSKEKEYLLTHTEKALYEGLSKVKDGIHLGDVSNAIEEYAKKHKLGVVKELVGHGIGSHLHEDPEVPNYGKAGTGIILKKDVYKRHLLNS